ncbi:YbhB/YbcL family Raf kinase inhibitor-like protein [Tritonibacter mobilis]|uniref:YbhB/YbcL family Raf kinase inhibitor-like protein n=1 Tax=Tritonibacter mobilis TaxID=379347 RepID=UPI003A5C6DB4
MLRTTLVSTALVLGSLVGPAAAETFTLTSTTIAEGQQLDAAQVFQGFGCEGGNTSPDLAWSGAPDGTESFAVTVYDPDAPTGSGWWHWFAFNIPADVTELPAGAGVPEGTVELTNDYGAVGFGGACPPPGEVHRYQFTVHALGTTLELDDSVSNALAGFMVNANSLASASITAVYTR